MTEVFAELVKSVETTLDIEAAHNHEYIIRKEFDERLGELSELKREAYQKLLKHGEKVTS